MARLIVFFLAVILVGGCSKNSTNQTNQGQGKMKYLGKIELTPKVPQDVSIGDGKGCTLTAELVPGGMGIHVAIATTNSDGTVTRSESQIAASNGQQCSIQVGTDQPAISFTPVLKLQ